MDANSVETRARPSKRMAGSAGNTTSPQGGGGVNPRWGGGGGGFFHSRYHPRQLSSSCTCRTVLPILICILLVVLSWFTLLSTPKAIQIRSSAGAGTYQDSLNQQHAPSLRPSTNKHYVTTSIRDNTVDEEQLLDEGSVEPHRIVGGGDDERAGGGGVVFDEIGHREVGLADVLLADNNNGEKKINIEVSSDSPRPAAVGEGDATTTNLPIAATQSKNVLPLAANSTTTATSSSSTVPHMKIDLVLYVVFQRELRGAMYQGMRWPWIPRLDDGIINNVNNGNRSVANGKLSPPLAEPSPAPPRTEHRDDDDDGDDEESVKKRHRKAERDVDSTPSTTKEVISHMVEEIHERDRTRVAFLAINPHSKHQYRVLRSQLLPSFFVNGSEHSKKERKKLEAAHVVTRGDKEERGGVRDLSSPSSHRPFTTDRQRDVRVYPVDFRHTSFLEGRVLREWEMPGYFRAEGTDDDGAEKRESTHDAEKANDAHHLLEEFGAMATLFRSGLTLMHTEGGAASGSSSATSSSSSLPGSRGARRSLAADADGDGVQEWMGILHPDMRIDVRLILLIRRRIRQGTARYLGINMTTTSSPPPNLPTKKVVKKSKIMFGGRVVQRDYEDQPEQPFLGDLGLKTLPKNHHCCVFYSGVYPAVFLFRNALGLVILEMYNSFFTSVAAAVTTPSSLQLTTNDNHHRSSSSSPALSSLMSHENITFERLCAKPFTDSNGVRHNNDAILEAFVIPNALFNSRVYPFLDHVIHQLIHNRFRFPSPEVSVEEYQGFMSSSVQHQQQHSSTSTPPSPPLQRKEEEHSWLLPEAPVTDVLERAVAITLGHAPRWLKIRLPVRHARDFAV